MEARDIEDRTDAGLIGRREELAALTGTLDGAFAGAGSVVLIAGEPGIGKTTLAQALADQARARGAVTVWGRCWDTGGAPAYWSWRQVVRKLADRLDDDELAAAAGPAGRWLVRIAPELDARLGGEDPVEPAEAEQARFALFDALAGFLRSCAARTPLVVLLDDLHAADIATLRALNFIAHIAGELPLLVVGTLQEVPLARRPDAAARVERLEHRGGRIDLAGLRIDELTQLLGEGVAPDIVRQVHRRSAGNPLFAGEIARLLPDGGSVDRLPSGVQAMLRDRLAGLGDKGVRVLTTAAVIGDEFQLITAERVAGLDRATLLDVLDDAEAAGVVQPVADSGRYRFRHGLIRETLYASMRKGERAQRHLEVGEVLRELYADQAQEGHLSELAHHFVEAAPLGDAGPAVLYSRLAGTRAMTVLAFEQAADHLHAALRAIELGTPDDAARGRLLLELGLAQAAFGHPDSEATLLSAAELARTLADPVLFADVALAVGPYGLSPGNVDERWVSLLEEALRGLAEDDEARRARLMAELGRALYFAAGQGERRVALADDSVAIARTVGSPRTLAAVLSDAHVAAWGPDRTHENLEWVAELHGLLDSLGDPRAGLPALVRSIDMHLELGDVVSAGIALERLEIKADELHDVRAAVLALLHRSRQAIAEGRFVTVPALLAEAARREDALRYSPVPILVAGQSFCVRLLCGGLVEFEPMVRQAADGVSGIPAWRAALARLYVEGGRDDEARRELDRIAAGSFGRVERDSFFLLTLGVYGEVAWRIGAREHAGALLELLTPFQDRMMLTTGALFLGPVRRVIGQLKALEGDEDAALAHFGAARDSARRMAAAPSVILVDVDEAAVRLAAGDREGAQALLEPARDTAAALGMKGVGARIQALEAAAVAPPTRSVVAARRGGRATGAGDGAPGAGESQAPILGRLACEGDTWRLQLGERSVRLRDAKGVQHLAVLLANPGVPIHAIDLVTGGAGPAAGGAHAQAAEAGLSTRADVGGVGPLLDDAAKQAYRERITDLRETLEEAERFNDPERAAAAREELDAILAQLAGAVGLGGRDRTTGSAAERARVNVTRALRGTLRRIGEHDAALGRDLEACVHTGTLCSYAPPALHPVTWEVDDGRG